MVGKTRIHDIHSEVQGDRLAAQVGGPGLVRRDGFIRAWRTFAGLNYRGWIRRRFSTAPRHSVASN
jgi:hypothetical protein